jgi:hypothetical protein
MKRRKKKKKKEESVRSEWRAGSSIISVFMPGTG